MNRQRELPSQQRNPFAVSKSIDSFCSTTIGSTVLVEASQVADHYSPKTWTNVAHAVTNFGLSSHPERKRGDDQSVDDTVKISIRRDFCESAPKGFV
nr:hypothetical protein CFP56_74974 [Quercus suber]